MRRFIRRAALAWALAATAATAHAQGAPLEDATLALPTTSLTFTVVYVAEAQGFFERAGLRLKSVVISGVGSANALIAGNVEFTMITASVFSRAVVHGQRMLAIANLLDRPMQELVLRKDIADAAGFDAQAPLAERAKILRGRTIAVDGILTNIHAFARLVVIRAGLDPERDIRIAPMAATSMPGALESKAVDAFTSSLPWTNGEVLSGHAVTVASSPRGDLPEYLPFAYLLVVTRPEVCRDRRTLCEKMVTGLVAAAQFIHEHPQETFAIAKKKFDQMGDDVLRDALAIITPATPLHPVVTVEELRNSESFNAAAGVVKPEETLKSYDGIFTDEFVR
jgi:NitT/TauT family transport system substrate-binding protein